MTSRVIEMLELLYQEKIYITYQEKGYTNTIFSKHNTFYVQTQSEDIIMQIKPQEINHIKRVLQETALPAIPFWIDDNFQGIYHFKLLYDYLKGCDNNTALFLLDGLECSFIIKYNNIFYLWSSNGSKLELYNYLPIRYKESPFSNLPTKDLWDFIEFGNQIILKKSFTEEVVEKLIDAVKKIDNLNIGSLRAREWVQKCKKECTSYLICWIYSQLHIITPLAIDYKYFVDDLDIINEVIIPYYKQQINIR